MNLIEYFSNSNSNDIAILINSLLNRLTILITGNNEQEIESFMNEIISLVPFRNLLIYYTDFTDTDDFLSFKETEQQDYDVKRGIYLCYPFASDKLIENFHNFDSWIIGVIKSDMNQNLMDEIKDKIYHYQPFYLYLEIKDNKFLSQIEGKNFPEIDLSFEKWIIENAIRNTEISIEKMKRVISKRIKSKNIKDFIPTNLLNFNYEENNIKYNLIRNEIIKFYQACKRSFSILNRIKILSEMGISSTLSAKTLYKTIHYDQASIKRIIKFIQKEWDIDFSNFLELKKISNFTDTFESLWG
jgi:hypothetical protein